MTVSNIATLGDRSPVSRYLYIYRSVGQPSDDSDDVDYRPTLLMKGQEGQSLCSPPTLRQERATKRLCDSHMRELSEVIHVNHSDNLHGMTVRVTVRPRFSLVITCCRVLSESVESSWRKTEYGPYSSVVIAVTRLCLVHTLVIRGGFR